MNKRLPLLFAALITLSLQSCGGLDFMRLPERGETPRTSAPSGKALVNFHRPSGFGGAAKYQVWDQSKMIGNTGGRTLFQYVCEPGKHIFLGDAQRTTVIAADLAADQVYDILINVGMGFFKANITMEPISKDSEKRQNFDRWHRSERFWILDESRVERFERRRGRWAEVAVRSFTEGDKQDRLLTLSADDHR